MKVDLHTHILPQDWPDLAAKYGYGDWPRLEMTGAGCGRMYTGTRPFRDIDDRCWDPARRLADCDRHGVDLQVLSTVPVMFCYWAQPRHALDLARLLNDHVAAVVRDHPGRFAGLGTVPLQDADLAIGELERCVKDLGLCGVQIGSHVNGWNLDDERLFPILERAAQLGAAVFVHPWDMLAKDRMQNYFLGWLVGMPAETTLAICSVVFGGVLERLPDLRIAFAHGGGGFPTSIGRIDQGWKARPDLCGQHIQVPPSHYLRRLYVDSLVHDAEVLRYLIGLLGADRVALGTDYPFPLGEPEPGSLIDGMPDLDGPTRDLLLGGSALEFLGIARLAEATPPR
jgi:aminocarboxymuconate-semialdehyde decarboxylase